MALAVRSPKFAFPHTEFNGDRAKKKTIVSFLYIFPYVAPYDSLYFSPYFFPVKRPLPSEAKKLHFHIQNFTVIEPKKGTNFSFLYIFPYVALYDSLYLSPYFFPVKWPWPSETNKNAFPHTEFNGDRAQKRYYFFIPLYLPLCRPL
jgi:hypothetical protein